MALLPIITSIILACVPWENMGKSEAIRASLLAEKNADSSLGSSDVAGELT